MIPASELRGRARALALQESHIRGDYVLNHVLASIAAEIPELTFRGGTALARVYWPDFRLSEDLDFITETSSSELGGRLARAVTAARIRMQLELELAFGNPKEGWSRSVVRSESGELRIDVNLNERSYLPNQRRRMFLPYSDLSHEHHEITAVSLAEILGNKWFMLGETSREEPRDLYDVWAAMFRFDVGFEELATGHNAKYGYPPNSTSIKLAHRLRERWTERLEYQLTDLPPFEEVLQQVQEVFESWERSQSIGR